METSTTPADPDRHMPAGSAPARHDPGQPRSAARTAVPLRSHLQSALTVGLALLILAAGWADVVQFPWWDALGVEPRHWWHLGPLALMAGALLLRVRRPLAALLLGLCCVLLDLSIGMNLGILLCLSDLVYSLGIRAPRRTVRITTAAFAVSAAGTTALLLMAGTGIRSSMTLGLGMAAVLLVPLWWAVEVRRGFPLWQDLDARGQLEAERHASLLRTQARERRQAVEEERRRMARELHDVVSSQVSAIALTSGAVLNTDPDGERDRRALQTVRSTSVDALEQLREMVQLLRGAADDDPSPDGPYGASIGAYGTARDAAHRAADVLEESTWQDVLDRAAAHGLRVTVHGAPPADLSPAVNHVLLRVLQESLTNAMKHGDGSAQVTMGPRRRRIRLVVTSGTYGPQRLAEDSGTRGGASCGTGLSTVEPGSADPAGAALSARTGLLTMRERVQQTGGRFRAGPHPEDASCWRVEAELPTRESRS